MKSHQKRKKKIMLQSLIGPVTGLLDKFIEDKDQKSALAHEIATMSERHAQELAKGQLEVNKVEAASTSLFVSGWRPAVGWVCVFGFAGNFITIPVTNMILELFSSEVRLPLIPMAEMMPVLMGMLGLGAMRSIEKVQKVSREK
tara:strand:+ start:13575 stop:14006 length:432 start_codon:yes stop_codon:yes gene_type:complete